MEVEGTVVYVEIVTGGVQLKIRTPDGTIHLKLPREATGLVRRKDEVLISGDSLRDLETGQTFQIIDRAVAIA